MFLGNRFVAFAHIISYWAIEESRSYNVESYCCGPKASTIASRDEITTSAVAENEAPHDFPCVSISAENPPKRASTFNGVPI